MVSFGRIFVAGIFLSCVSNEFHGDTSPNAIPWPGSYRAQLARFLQQCGQQVVYQETFAQGGGDLLAKLNKYIAEECRAVVHLIGHAAGWSPDDDSPDAVHALLARYGDSFLATRPALRERLVARGFRGISATQWEAYLAIHHNKPLLVFTFADSAERSPIFQRQVSPRADRWSQAEHFELLKLTSFDRSEQIADQHQFKEAAIAALVRERVITQAESSPPPRCTEFSSIGSLFIGRRPAMQALRASLLQATTRATAIVASQVIHGQGGIGKTRLAIEFGLAHAEEYSALLFVRADNPQTLESSLADLVGPLVLGLPESAKQDEKLAAVWHWLRTHPGYFLILDNVDSEEAARAVEDKLARLSEGHVVITSRITNWSASVEPLHLDVLSEDDSTDFLLRATERKAGSGRAVTSTDAADARLLARDVAGLALALEQSAAFIRTKQSTFAKYRQRWAEFDLKVRDFYDERLTKYPYSILTTWATTFEQLTPGAVTLLRACSVLAPAAIPTFLLEFVDSECEDDLAELGKFSLAERSDDGMAVQVHKVVQEIVRFRLSVSELRATVESVLRSVRRLFADLEDHTQFSRRSAVLSHAEMLLGHAARVSAASVDNSCARLRNELAWHQWHSGQLPAAMINITASIDWGQRQSPVDERSLAIDRATRASIRQHQGDLPGALEDITASLDWGQQQSPVDERGLAILRATWASIRKDQGDLPGALEDITASIDWGQRQSPVDERSIAIDRVTLASILRARQDVALALSTINASLDWFLAQSPRNERWIAKGRATRARILQDANDTPAARADITAALAWYAANLPLDTRTLNEFRQIEDDLAAN